MATNSSAKQSLKLTYSFVAVYFNCTGDAPLVIARGGFSGIFPASSYNAYMFALGTSLQNTVLWCDVQLTKDGVGICFPDIKLDNGSDINVNQKNKQKTYLVNGVPTTGWFSIDYTFKELQLLNCKFTHLNAYMLLTD